MFSCAGFFGNKFIYVIFLKLFHAFWQLNRELQCIICTIHIPLWISNIKFSSNISIRHASFICVLHSAHIVLYVHSHFGQKINVFIVNFDFVLKLICLNTNRNHYFDMPTLDSIPDANTIGYISSVEIQTQCGIWQCSTIFTWQRYFHPSSIYSIQR